MMTGTALKLLIPALIAFSIGIGSTPFISKILYKNKLWKRKPRKIEASEDKADEMSQAFKQINNDTEETSTPRIGGVVIWFSVLATVLFVWLLSRYAGGGIGARFDFLSRSQTWLPITALIFGSTIGLVDDLMGILVTKGTFINGFPRSYMVFLVTVFGLGMGSWFFYKLGFTGITIPFYGFLSLGIWFIPVFLLVTWGTFSSGVIDGIDGLAGGVLAVIFGAYALIAFLGNKIDIATLSLVITSGILAFLWFNIPPARFYMGETGMLGLTFTLTVIVFLTDTLVIFPIIALPLVVTALSSFIQIYAKKIFKRKVFIVAPLHHHFEALGWSRPKITMRYWVFSLMVAILGVILVLLGSL